MKVLAAIFSALLLFALPLASPAAGDLLARMAALNPNVHSFTATLHAKVALTTFPFLGAQLVGTYYHKEPSHDKVVFTSGVPAVAAQFSKLYPHIVSPSQWATTFHVTLVSDDGTSTAFRLVPRKRGNVERIDAKVNDRAATIDSMRWEYSNGGYADMNVKYAKIDGNTLVVSQNGHVDEPGYKADITSTLGGYKINPPLADSFFSE